MLDDFLLGPSTRGQLVGRDGQAVPYEMRLLSDARIEALASERDAHLAARGIDERSPSTEAVFDDELALRMCAASVRRPEDGAPLLSLEHWRLLDRALISLVIAHYTALMESEQPTPDQLGAMYAHVHDQVCAMRSSPTRALEDHRLRFAIDLEAYYGKPAVELCLRQLARHMLHLGELVNKDA